MIVFNRVSRRCHDGHLSAFTLVELLVTVAIVVLLMAGVAGVFGIAGETVSAGQKSSAVTRDARAAEAVFSQDTAAMASDGPVLLIRSGRVPAFLDRADQEGDLDYDPTSTNVDDVDRAIRTLDLDGNNLESDAVDQTPRAIIGRRNFRVDQLAFFARGLFRRQTGNAAGEFASDVTAPEALIWYGHLRLPSIDTGTGDPYRTPGFYKPSDAEGLAEGPFNVSGASNPNNFFATDFTLGRMVYLMREPDQSTGATNGQIEGETYISGAGQAAANQSDTLDPKATYRAAAPFTSGIQSTLNGSVQVGAFTIDRSRYDLVGASLDSYRDTLEPLLPPTVLPGGLVWSDVFMNFRPKADPIPALPMDAVSSALVAPVLIRGAPSFVVEFAGDYFTQDPLTGVISGAVGDGTTDFIIDGAVRRTRWYGYPRDTNGDGQIKGGAVAAGDDENDLLDVVPLRDVADAASAAGPALVPPFAYTFERFDSRSDPSNTAANTLVVAKERYEGTATLPLGVGGNEYVAAWTPSDVKPDLLRLTVQIIGPSGGAAGEGQTFEYVYAVP